MTAILRVDGQRGARAGGAATRLDPETARATIAVEAPAAPDHVPDGLATEHPDAARVVAERARRAATVRVVSRGPHRRSPSWLVLGLAACAALAAFASQPGTPTEPVARGARPVLVQAGGARADAASCGAVRSVVLQCEPSCPPLSAISPTFGCGSTPDLAAVAKTPVGDRMA